jgi:hypothetical protein
MWMDFALERRALASIVICGDAFPHRILSYLDTPDLRAPALVKYTPQNNSGHDFAPSQAKNVTMPRFY